MKVLCRILIVMAVITLTADCLYAQRRQKTKVGASAVWGSKTTTTEENALNYIVEGKDTIYIDHLEPSKVYSFPFCLGSLEYTLDGSR